MSGNIQVVTESFLNVTVTSNINSFGTEKHFPKDLTIAALKGKLELVTGASAATMKLSVLDKDNKFICNLDNDESLLGSYPVDSGMKIHVEDKQLSAGEFSDVSKVEKYEIPEEEYSKRTDSVRAFKERNKLGRLETGVRFDWQGIHAGEEQYGTTDFKPGLWVGVQYDEPFGKNDGSVNGKRYFECPPKYGGFVKPTSVEVGDFPEEDLGFDEDEM
ncbi:hypothetical protein BaRGS_00020117 [Batillaria attramentaria]|uniref:CAP-Gly domain-containing protein n=1 Tax=Batillaria attramentaria TaxID=370345 RepID=A0ABD0KNN6_9CAEN